VPDDVLGDAGRLRQVLNNLVNNALKFTKKGRVGVVASLAGEQPEDNARRVRFAVQDTGVGISAEKVGRIFESFEQAHTSAHAEYGGTGLGLTISRRLVELMGGDIDVESSEGEGSTFTFDVLLELVESPVKSEPVTPARDWSGRSLSILVAEDNSLNQLFIKNVLESEGHEVEIVETGQEALDKLAQGEYDLVLMDIRMPDMGGDEATRIIRSEPPPGVDSDIPIIALTAYALKEEMESFMQCGFNAYLTKPVEMDRLNEVLAGL
jgi:CheY-like chemotaxis protein